MQVKSKDKIQQKSFYVTGHWYGEDKIQVT